MDKEWSEKNKKIQTLLAKNATLAWSLWHLFRIEDIVVHTLILNDSQILFENSWQAQTNSPIITTGNELDGEAMIEFSKKLCDYCCVVSD